MRAGSANTRRVVITGVGVVSPIGVGKVDFWNSLLSCRSGIGFLRAFPGWNLPSKVAAEVVNFDPSQWIRHRKTLKVMSRDIQLGVASANIAVDDASLTHGTVDPERLGVVFGASRITTTPQELAEAVAACSTEVPFDYNRWGEDSMGQIYPLWLLKQLPNMPACHVSIDHDARGPNNTITSREASALLAVAEAYNVIQRNAADAMIVGACGSDIHPVDIARLNLYEHLSQREGDPTRACRPFDIDRDGCIVGEGAATFVLEEYEFARARGANIYAEVVGTGAGCDGKGYQNGSGGTGLVNAMQAALRNAAIDPRQIGHINAHGKSTRRDDFVESRAYHRTFGDLASSIPVTGLKSYFGAFDAGSGAVELAGSVLALQNRMIPATLNYETPDPKCPLNVVRGGAIRELTGVALSVNRTAMGQSAAVVLRAI